MSYIKKRATAPFNGRVALEQMFKEAAKPSNARYDREIDFAAASALHVDENLQERVNAFPTINARVAEGVVGESNLFMNKVVYDAKPIAPVSDVDYFCITPDAANTSFDARFFIYSDESDSNDEPELHIEYSTDKSTWTEQAEYIPDYITIDDPARTGHFNYVGSDAPYFFWQDDEVVIGTMVRSPQQGDSIYEYVRGQIVESEYKVSTYTEG